MTTTTGLQAQVLGPEDGDLFGLDAGSQDRFLVDDPHGVGIAIAEHRLAPRALAAPLHRHSREDEFSIVLAGRVGALLGDREVVAGPGSVVVKPRGQWHTFWNAGDEPARLIEVIAPGGLEQLFRRLDARETWPEPQELAELAGAYGCDVDFERTLPLLERHGLVF